MAGRDRDAELLRNPERVLEASQVSAAELEGILVQRVRDQVEVALQGEEGGEHALAAQWARGRPVSERGLAYEPDLRDAVEGEGLPGGGAQQRLTARRTGPGVHEKVENMA